MLAEYAPVQLPRSSPKVQISIGSQSISLWVDFRLLENRGIPEESGTEHIKPHSSDIQCRERYGINVSRSQIMGEVGNLGG